MTIHIKCQRSGEPANGRTPSVSPSSAKTMRLLLTVEEAADRLGTSNGSASPCPDPTTQQREGRQRHDHQER